VLQKEPPQWWAYMEDRELVSAISKQHFSVLRTPTGSLCTQTKHDGRRKRKIGEHCDAFGPLLPLLQVPIEPFLGVFAKCQEENISFAMSVRPFVRLSAWNNLAPRGGISMK